LNFGKYQPRIMTRTRKHNKSKVPAKAKADKVKTGLNPTAEGGFFLPSPPNVSAYRDKYDDYLADYEKYRQALIHLRKEASATKQKGAATKKSTSSKSGVRDHESGFIVNTKAGPVEVVRSAVWSTTQVAVGDKLERFLKVDELDAQPTVYDHIDDYYHPKTSFESVGGSHVTVKLPDDIQWKSPASGSGGPLPKTKVTASKVVRKKNVKPSQRALKSELKAVTMAANLATTIAKGEKAAARAGRSIVKTSDGWNLVVKGQRKTKEDPKAGSSNSSGYSDPYSAACARFVLKHNATTLLEHVSTLSPGAGNDLRALAGFELGKVVPILKNYAIPAAIFKLD